MPRKFNVMRGLYKHQKGVYGDSSPISSLFEQRCHKVGLSDYSFVRYIEILIFLLFQIFRSEFFVQAQRKEVFLLADLQKFENENVVQGCSLHVRGVYRWSPSFFVIYLLFSSSCSYPLAKIKIFKILNKTNTTAFPS